MFIVHHRQNDIVGSTEDECAAASVYIARGSRDTVTDSNRTLIARKMVRLCS